MHKIDAKGLVCPRPVILAKKALADYDAVNIEVDNPTSKENLEKMAVVMKLKAETKQDGKNYSVILTKTSESVVTEQAQSGYAVVIDSQYMGSGNEELGSALMKSFIYTLTENETLPSVMLFYNGGVKLTTADSPVLEDLEKLSRAGVEILSCGACLNYYGLTEALKVGSVTNMYVILEKQRQAEKIIKI